ncbi:MAG: cobalamin-binding protein [Rhodocyclaceae bacterium]
MLRLLLSFAALMLCIGAARAEVAVRDDSGQWVRLAQPARRIVSLAPHMTENLYAAGAGEYLVGAVEYSDYPEAALALPRVGGYTRVDLEAVMALRPDLVVVWQSGNAQAQMAKLRALGVPLYVSQPNRIEDIAAELERLGTLAGREARARDAAERFHARLAALRDEFSGRPPVRTFYQVWHRPLVTVGGAQIISAGLRLCGGDNVFESLPRLGHQVTVEAVIQANPEAIVASGTGEGQPESLDGWRRWQSITAVRRDNLFFVPPPLIQRHTSRFLDGVELLCRQLETARGRRP